MEQEICFAFISIKVFKNLWIDQLGNFVRVPLWHSNNNQSDYDAELLIENHTAPIWQYPEI